MRVLFCHDGPVRKDEFNNYYGVAHNDELFTRYYTIADELAVLIRVNEIPKHEAEKKFSRITVSPFEVIQCPNMTSLKGLLFNNKKARETIFKEVEKSDYVIARLPSTIGYISVKSAIRLRKPYLIEVVACAWDSLWYHSFKGKLIAPIQFFLTKKIIENADNVVYITEKFLQNRYPSHGKKFICPNVSLKDFNGDILKNRFDRIETMKNERTIVIGSVGAINVRYKGHAFMIRTIKDLIKQGYNIEYHIVGGGCRNYLEKVALRYQVSDRIVFHGPIAHDKIFGFLDNIDIYVQPSLAEAQGRSLVEAMSRACPCICTNAGGMPELLDNNFIAKKGSSKSLVQKITLLLQSDLYSIARRNYEFAKKFESDSVEKKRTEIFNDVFIEKRGYDV